MSELLTPKDVQRLAREQGLTMAAVCRRAGVHTSIFARWKQGKTEPSLENYRRIRAALFPCTGSADASPESQEKAA